MGENKWEAQDLARASGRFPPALHPQCSSMWHVLLGEQQLSVFINIRESEFNKPGNNAIQISFHPFPPLFFLPRCKAFEMQGVIVTATKWVTD